MEYSFLKVFFVRFSIISAHVFSITRERAALCSSIMFLLRTVITIEKLDLVLAVTSTKWFWKLEEFILLTTFSFLFLLSKETDHV